MRGYVRVDDEVKVGEGYIYNISGRGIYFGMIGRERTLDARNTRQARAEKSEATL